MVLSHILSFHKRFTKGLEFLPREFVPPWTRLGLSYVDYTRLPKRHPGHWMCHLLAIIVHPVIQVREYSLDVDGM
jgi:hypothetical protein